jgi:hypothetical protein
MGGRSAEEIDWLPHINFLAPDVWKILVGARNKGEKEPKLRILPEYSNL